MCVYFSLGPSDGRSYRYTVWNLWVLAISQIFFSQNSYWITLYFQIRASKCSISSSGRGRQIKVEMLVRNAQFDLMGTRTRPIILEMDQIDRLITNMDFRGWKSAILRKKSIIHHKENQKQSENKGKNLSIFQFLSRIFFFELNGKALILTIHASNLYIIWVWWGCPSISIPIKPLIVIVCNPRKVVASKNPANTSANFTQGSNQPNIATLEVPDCTFIHIIFPAWFSIHNCCTLISFI